MTELNRITSTPNHLFRCNDVEKMNLLFDELNFSQEEIEHHILLYYSNLIDRDRELGAAHLKFTFNYDIEKIISRTAA